MEKDNNLQQLLKKISAMAAAIMAANGLAQAQVIITDPVNDTVKLNQPAFNIDLNNDGQPDYKIQVQSSTYTSTFTSTYGTYRTNYHVYKYGIQPYDKNAFNNKFVLATNYIQHFLSNDKISANLNFNSIGTVNGQRDIRFKRIIHKSTSHISTSTLGHFQHNDDGFIAVKFYDTGNNIHYGWIKIQVWDKKIVIKKWAYEQTADSIFAGTKPLLLSALDTTSDGATIGIKSKFNGNIHYVVIEATQPLPDWQQILNGQDGNGNPALIADSLQVNNAPDDTLKISLTGLNPNTLYRFCMISSDINGDDDKDVYSTDFKTKEGTSTDITEISGDQIKLYPNPAKTNFLIDFSGTIDKLEISDLSGRIIKTITYPQKNKIDINNLLPGIYNITLHTRGKIYIKKLIKY